MPRANKPTREIAADTAQLSLEMRGRENGMAGRIAEIVDRYFFSIAALIAKQPLPTYAEILVGIRAAHLLMAEALQKQFGREVAALNDYAHRRAVNNVLNALPTDALEHLIATVRPEPLPTGIDVERAAKAIVFRPDEYRVGTIPASLIADTTRLGNPEKIAAAVNRVRLGGGTARDVMKTIRPMVQGVKATVARVTRDAGQFSTTLKNVETWQKLGEMVVGLQVHAVPRTEFSRPDHLERSGTIYYYRPLEGQRSIAECPMPPYDREGGALVLKHNCRCYLSPVFVSDLTA